MKYTIDFELPDNDTVLKNIKSTFVEWTVWGFSGYCKAKPAEKNGHKINLRQYPSAWKCSECGSKHFDFDDKYCSQCGADVRGN